MPRPIENFRVELSTDADTGKVEVRVMPYGVASERYDFWRDETRMIQFDQGSLEMPDSIPLTVDHSPETLDRIGVLSASMARPDGLYATLEFAATQKAQDARELVRIGAVPDVSAGVWLDDDAEFTDDDGTVHLFGKVDHVALVPHGQFGEAGAGSKVLAVHSKERGSAMEPTVETAPVVEPVIEYAKADEVDALRLAVAELSIPGTVEARPTEYRELGSIFTDVIGMARGNVDGAAERLAPLIDAGAVSADGRGVNMAVANFAFPAPPGNSVGGGVAFGAYVPELLELLRQGRPTVELMPKRQLPTEGNQVLMPAVNVGNIVDYQGAQGDQLASQNQEQILTSVDKVTIGGGQGVSVQAQQWTSPSYMESVVSDLTEAYAEFQNSEAINGLDGGVIGAGEYNGILNVGATDIPVGGSPLAAIPLLGTAWAAVWEGTKRSPSHAIMAPAMWGALLNEVDTDGRPIIQNIGVVNPVGTGDAGSPAGTLRGLAVVIDDSCPATVIIVTNFRDTIMFEDGGSPTQLRLTYPDVLVTDVSIFGFSALFIRRPEAYAVLSGITIP